MHVTMSLISPAAALFYVCTIVIGCYVLLNLFLAILLNNLNEVSALAADVPPAGLALRAWLALTRLAWRGGAPCSCADHGGEHGQLRV